MSCAKKSRGSVDCDCGFVRMCFENVFQCHVLLSWMTFASAFFILIALDNGVVAFVQTVFKQFYCFASFQAVFCEIVTEIVGQRWPRGATRSLSQRLRLSFEAFIS